LSAFSGGEVQLLPALVDDFPGSTLSSNWNVISWVPQGGGPLNTGVSNGIFSVAGAEVFSAQAYNSAIVQGRVSFGAAAYQHFGMATDLSAVAGNSWAIFSTAGTT